MNSFSFIQAQTAMRLRAAAQERGQPSIQELFFIRVGRLMDEIEGSAAVSGLVERTFSFRDGGRETFMLHPSADVSSCAGFDAPMNKRTGVVSLLAMLRSALDVPSFTKEVRLSLANYSNRRGLTPLSLVTDPADAAALVELGANPILAMDGALFLAVKEKNPRYVISLIYSLQNVTDMVALVNHTRVDGVNPLMAAVLCGNCDLLKELVAMGARVDKKVFAVAARGDADMFLVVKSLTESL
jgi:hypothetical protein